MCRSALTVIAHPLHCQDIQLQFRELDWIIEITGCTALVYNRPCLHQHNQLGDGDDDLTREVICVVLGFANMVLGVGDRKRGVKINVVERGVEKGEGYYHRQLDFQYHVCEVDLKIYTD